MTTSLKALIAAAAVLAGGALLFQSANIGTAALWEISDEGRWLLPLVMVSSLLDSINPCAFSIMILTIAFLFSIGKARSGIVEIGAVYILGIFLVYTLIGLGLLQVLHLFDTPHFMAKAGAFLLIALGAVNLANHWMPAFPIKPRIPAAAHARIAVLMNQASLPSAFALGGLVGLCEFPCTGGPYLMVLGLLHDRASYATGLGYLMLYNVIFVLPLAIILLIASDQSLLRKVEGWKKRNTSGMRVWVGGFGMIALGSFIFAL